MQVLCSSKMKFVSLSQLLGCPFFGSNSGLFTVPGFIVSHPLGYGCACGAFCDAHFPRCLWSQVPPSCTFPGTLDLGSMPHTPPWERWAAGWRGDWSCCGRIPQSAPECFFLFEKNLLLSPAAPYKEGLVFSHSPPLQLDLVVYIFKHITNIQSLPYKNSLC